MMTHPTPWQTAIPNPSTTAPIENGRCVLAWGRLSYVTPEPLMVTRDARSSTGSAPGGPIAHTVYSVSSRFEGRYWGQIGCNTFLVLHDVSNGHCNTP